MAKAKQQRKKRSRKQHSGIRFDDSVIVEMPPIGKRPARRSLYCKKCGSPDPCVLTAPPHDLQEAVTMGLLAEITPQIETDYVAAMYPASAGKVKPESKTKAVLMMAALGFAFLNMHRTRQRQ